MSEPSSLARLGTSRGRGILAATVLGSGIVFLDGLIVNIALPQMDQDLALGVSGFQWTVSGYLLSLSALLLLGGSLGDTFGRRRIYLIGIAVFAASSAACGLAPNAAGLVIARIVQGIGGALMIPASLAVIQSSFQEEDRGRAIGTWTGLSAAFTAIGPFIGGLFVTYVSWRWAFFINVPLGVIAIWATLRWVPESYAETSDGAHRRLDIAGAVLAGLALGGITYWSIEGATPDHDHTPLLIGIGGIAFALAFVYSQAKGKAPMLPLSMFKNRQFTWVNVCTFIFYGAFVSGTTLSGIRLQTDMGYTAFVAGLSSFPVSILMFTLAGRFGGWGQRIGPKIPMTLGPLLVALGLVGMSFFADGRGYWTFVFPVMIVWGFGLAMTVAPLTAAALSAADDSRVGIASAFNNAVSRIGQSFGIALIPLLAGMGGAASLQAGDFQGAYEKAVLITAALSVVAAVTAALFVAGKTPKALKEDQASTAG